MPHASNLPAGAWRRSSYSNQNGGNCLEVADGIPSVVPVRDSKCPAGSVLVIPADAWSAFVADMRRGALGGR